jgi:hypothetical protein
MPMQKLIWRIDCNLMLTLLCVTWQIRRFFQSMMCLAGTLLVVIFRTLICSSIKLWVSCYNNLDTPFSLILLAFMQLLENFHVMKESWWGVYCNCCSWQTSMRAQCTCCSIQPSTMHKRICQLAFLKVVGTFTLENSCALLVEGTRSYYTCVVVCFIQF